MKLLLISPEVQDSTFRFTPKEVRAFWFPRLSLPLLAALTPPEIEVRIVDECVEEVDFEEPAHLVGISLMTYMAPRGYEIAAAFRSRGIKVILGGHHPSALPEEAIQHADALVIGEAEGVWGKLLADFRAGRLQKFYRSMTRPNLAGLPRPRLDLLKQEAYMTPYCVQSTRGCPFNCDFCSVTDFFGNTFRLRPVEEVIEEVKSLPGDFLFFVDDNIAGNKAYARRLFETLIPLGKKWAGQSNLNLAEDPELLDLAARSGCTGLFVGIESLSQAALNRVGKAFNRVKRYGEYIRRFHDHGILLDAGIIFGLDEDDESVFERTVEFLERNRVELALFNLLTPLPGTALYRRLEKEGRIFDRNWAHYDGRHVVFEPKNMTVEVLQEGFYWACHRFFSHRSILKRFLRRQPYYFSRLYLNYGHRRFVNRMPEGWLTPLSRVLSKIPGFIPNREKPDFVIPNTLEPSKAKIGVPGRLESYLNIEIRPIDRLRVLKIELEGAMDRLGAKKLLQRIDLLFQRVKSQRVKMDVIIDFKGLGYVTPKALEVLSARQAQELFRKGKVQLLNVHSTFRELLERINQARGLFEILEGEEEIP